MPTIHEVPLDMTFIQYFLGVSAPRLFPSGWTVEIRTHYLGGGRHYGEWGDWPRKWEIADIGLLLMFRQGGKLLRTKVALLQSKRLYPNEQDFEEDTPLQYMAGFGGLLADDGDWAAVTESRTFCFNEESRYAALLTGTTQFNAIRSYETQRGVPVYYLLYNPLSIPSVAQVPASPSVVGPASSDVACRVVTATSMRGLLSAKSGGYSPTYHDLATELEGDFSLEAHRAGWRLEHFVADRLLECEGGYIAASRTDAGLDYIFNRRGGPISAAIAVTLDAPA